MDDNVLPLTPAMPEEASPESVLEQLAARARDIADTKETFAKVPGYDKEPPLLFIKYRLLDGPELDGIGRRVAKQFQDRWQRTLFAGVDTIVAACSGIFTGDGKSEPQPLTIAGEPILGFTSAFAQAMQFADKLADSSNPRNVVLGLFNGNDVALTQHVFRLNRWMGDTTIDVNQELLGNL